MDTTCLLVTTICQDAARILQHSIRCQIWAEKSCRESIACRRMSFRLAGCPEQCKACSCQKALTSWNKQNNQIFTIAQAATQTLRPEILTIYCHTGKLMGHTNTSAPLGDVLLCRVKGGLASKDDVLVTCCGLQVNLHVQNSTISTCFK